MNAFTRGAAALVATIALAGCGSVADPNPQPDHRPPPAPKTITMHWYSNQPYRAKWKITRRDGSLAGGIQAENPDLAGEPVASGEFKHDITVGPTELIITITIVMGSRDATGWVKITQGSRELAYEPADKGTRQGTANYHYKP